MTPEERQLLNHSIKLAEENNKMLRSIRRSARVAAVLRVVYWLIIIGISFGAYYFAEPYINAAIKSYNDMKSNVQNVTNKIPALPNLFDKEQ